MEHGTITAVRYDSGVVLCDVRLTGRTNTEEPNVPMLKPASAFSAVPTIGQKAALTTLDDGTMFITDVMSQNTNGSAPASLEEGEVALQFDAGTKLTFTKNGDGNYDVNVSASGTVFIDGIDFTNHTHDYEDSTDTASSTKTTSAPK